MTSGAGPGAGSGAGPFRAAAGTVPGAEALTYRPGLSRLGFHGA
ncbi:hypothetical protein ACVWXU_004675 [Streptomyces sp. TE33382]